jgi:hypothetical protein
MKRVFIGSAYVPRGIACLACLIAIAAANPAPAEVYKWVDDEGRVHFTDSPPPKKGSKVELDVRKPSNELDEGELLRRDLLRQAEISSEQEERWEAHQERDVTIPRHNARACDQARVSWYVLTQEMPVYWTEDGVLRAHWSLDTYRGERRYVADAQRAEVLAQVEQDVFLYCKNRNVENDAGTAYRKWLRSEWCEVYKVKLATARDKKSRTPRDKVEEIETQVGANCS